jgi:hypothetical protein
MFRFVRGGNLTLFGGSLILNNLNDSPEWRAHTVYPPHSIVYFDGRRFRTNKGGTSGDHPIEHVNAFHFDGGIEWNLEADESAYLLRVGGDLTGQINTFLISGARVELRSNRSKLLTGGDLNTGSLITFDSIAVQPVIGGPRHTIELAESSASVRFLHCKLSRASSDWEEPFSAAFASSPSGLDRRNGARILLDGCLVSERIHDLSSWGDNSKGALTLEKCTVDYQDPHQAPGQSNSTIVDGTTSAPTNRTSIKGFGVTRYARHLLLPFEYWPGALPVDSINLCLPPQAIVACVRFLKRSSGAGAGIYRVFLREHDGNDLFRSDPVNLDKPFEIVTPRLYARSISASFRLSIQGSDHGTSRVQAGPDDCIILEWI